MTEGPIMTIEGGEAVQGSCISCCKNLHLPDAVRRARGNTQENVSIRTFLPSPRSPLLQTFLLGSKSPLLIEGQY